MNITEEIENPSKSIHVFMDRFFLTTFLSQILQLGIVGYFVWALNIESDLGFVQFFPLLFLAFVVHSLSAPAYRPIVFLGSFVLTLYLFLGGWDAMFLLFLGLFIFWVCHLPIALWMRKLMVLGIGILLALGKIGLIWLPLSSHGLTVIAAIFMFRVILYLNELKHQREQASVWHRLNYFFLLPNIIFPFFPIVDYQTYLRTYYDKKDTDIYQKGINLIIWSVICLLTYRGLYYFVVPDLTAIDGAGGVALYIVSTYLTVIRLVGLFSMSVGILRLFGYNLPDIFRYMFFASSFLDLFRRVNIYWKNFLIKICFYPFYMRIRKVTPEYALALSILLTFFFTYVFHIYQWAWVLGTNPIRDTSLLFWGTFGILATINSLYEEKKKKKGSKSLASALAHAAKVVGVFITMAVLYSMWTLPTFLSWTAIVQIGLQDDLGSWLKILAVIMAVIAMGGWLYYLYLNHSAKAESAFATFAGKPILSYLSLAAIGILLTGFSNNDKAALFIDNYELNTNDASQEFDGYYEDILKANISSKLWDDDIDQSLDSRNWQDLLVVRAMKAAWSGAKEELLEAKIQENIHEKEMNTVKMRPTNDILIEEYLPNQRLLVKGKRFSTNQWGMRDQDYEKVPPANAFRIAVMGSSPTLGLGVHDEEVFEQLVEDRLNEKFGNDTLVYELLNFARPNMHISQQAYLLQHQVSHFQPDLVILFTHCKLKTTLFRLLRKVLRKSDKLYPELQEFIDKSRIDLENRPNLAEKIELSKMTTEWSYSYFYELSERYELSPAIVYFPSFINGESLHNYYEELKLNIDSIGYDFIDMKDVFEGYKERDLYVSDHDRHPSVLGQRLVADRFFEELVIYLNLNK